MYMNLNDKFSIPKSIEKYHILVSDYDEDKEILRQVVSSQTKKILMIQPRNSMELIITIKLAEGEYL